MNTFKYLFLILSLSLSTIGCRNNFYENKIDELDSSQIKNTEKRVVALSSISADIVNYLSPDNLVAIPGSSLFKDNKDFLNKPRISMGRTPPNLEKIISLKPDIVIGVEGFHSKILKKLSDLKIKTISYELRNWDDLKSLINLINIEISQNKEDMFESLLSNNLDNCADFGALEADYKKNLVVIASPKPILSPNSNSWAGEMLNRFNFNNLTKDIDSKSLFKGYVNLSPEWLLKNDPENIILIETRKDQLKDFGKREPFSNLNAVKTNKVYRFKYYGLINPGSLSSINKACRDLRSIN